MIYARHNLTVFGPIKGIGHDGDRHLGSKWGYLSYLHSTGSDRVGGDMRAGCGSKPGRRSLPTLSPPPTLAGTPRTSGEDRGGGRIMQRD